MTGELLFFLYAFPCADIRYTNGHITHEQLVHLQEVKEGYKKPSRKLLKWCFPNAFRSIREQARHTNMPTWSLENVASYWRENHGHKGFCRVLRATVVHVGKNHMIQVKILGEEVVYALNPYLYFLSIGEVYYMHQFCLIEKAVI